MPSAKRRANSEYAQRIDRVMDYLRGNLHRQVKLEELAKVPCSSEFHFYRIFGAVSGETLDNFTNWLRLEQGCSSSSLFPQEFDRYSLRSRLFIIGHFFACLPIQLLHFARSVSKKRRDQREQDLQRTLHDHEYDLPMSPEEERAAFPVRLIDVPER